MNKPHLHILGVGGTFMAGVATIAQQLGWHVTGSDKPLYPPMSDYLARQDLILYEGYSEHNLTSQPDCIVVGNAVARGNPELEAILERHWPVTSGPQWLYDNVLKHRNVIAVAGTHGKTTTSSLIAWLLEANGQKPGFLIGGLANNFTDSARLGEGQYFVIEADEYDSAFFDKRSKFVHYWPDIAVLNNLEFDHADIYPDLEAIQNQFHYLCRILPGNGLFIANQGSQHLHPVFKQGQWTPITWFNDPKGYHAQLDGSSPFRFTFYYEQEPLATFQSSLLGEHNRQNIQAALLVGNHIGLNWQQCQQALVSFKGVQRRLEVVLQPSNDITVYQDFAHHPTAIKSTIAAMRERQVDSVNLLYVAIDFGSYTMRNGVHSADSIIDALQEADQVYLWASERVKADNLYKVQKHLPHKVTVVDGNQKKFAERLAKDCVPQMDLVLMSNRNFANMVDELKPLLT